MLSSTWWIRRALLLSVCVTVSLVTLHLNVKDDVTAPSEESRAQLIVALKACQEAHAANPGKCGLFGKIKIVKSFPDVKVQVVKSFPDLKVQVVNSFPDKPGKWQFVNSFPDYKVQYVDSFPDIKVQFVKSFPGCE